MASSVVERVSKPACYLNMLPMDVFYVTLLLRGAVGLVTVGDVGSVWGFQVIKRPPSWRQHLSHRAPKPAPELVL